MSGGAFDYNQYKIKKYGNASNKNWIDKAKKNPKKI